MLLGYLYMDNSLLTLTIGECRELITACILVWE
jgi:hypothetical protein